jgi:predicted ferric reductase
LETRPVSEASSEWDTPIWSLIAAIAVVAGAALALVVIPAWLPVLGTSVVGVEPKVYWYLSRASGLTAFVLLWLSMASGLIISNKMARVWPGAFTAFDLHQFTSLLGLGFIGLHVLTLLGDHYIGYNLAQVLVPFADAPYRPVWVALGQVGLYLLVPVTFTYYIRKQIGNRAWRAIHYLSYAVFAMALLHGLFSGTDSSNVWVLRMYWVSAVSLLALTAYRLANIVPSSRFQARNQESGIRPPTPDS